MAITWLAQKLHITIRPSADKEARQALDRLRIHLQEETEMQNPPRRYGQVPTPTGERQRHGNAEQEDHLLSRQESHLSSFVEEGQPDEDGSAIQRSPS